MELSIFGIKDMKEALHSFSMKLYN